MTEYTYNEAGQLKERRWAREGSPQRAQRGTEAEGSAGAPARTDGRLATLYEYDPATLQLAKSTATDGTEVQYEYDSDGRVAKVTDATGTREFAYDLRGQVVRETAGSSSSTASTRRYGRPPRSTSASPGVRRPMAPSNSPSPPEPSIQRESSRP